MSLILDALRKLEREKSAHEPGVLVVGSVPWDERSRAGRLALAGTALLVVAAAMLAGWLLRRAPAPPAAAHPVEPAAAPTPLPSPREAAAPTVEPSPLAAEPPPSIQLSHAPSAAARGRAPESKAPPEEPLPDAQPAASSPPSHAGATGAAQDLRLSAISQRDGKPVALINDRLVFEGDSFDGVRVLHIGETEVEIEVKGHKKVLRF